MYSIDADSINCGTKDVEISRLIVGNARLGPYVGIVASVNAFPSLVVGLHEHIGTAFHEIIHSLECRDIRVLEEGSRRTAAQTAVLDLRLQRQLFGVLYRVNHFLDGQKGGQIGGV